MCEWVDVHMSAGPERVVVDDPDPTFVSRRVGFWQQLDALDKRYELIRQEQASIVKPQDPLDWQRRQRGRAL